MEPSEIFRHLVLMAGRYELWAIPVEFRYYFIIPCIIVGVSLMGRARMLLLLGLLTVAAFAYDLWRPGTVLQDSIALVPNLLPFLTGSLLALLLSARPLPGAEVRRWLGIPSLALLLGATLLLRHLQGVGHPALWKPVLVLAFSLAVSGIIIASLEADLVSRLLGTRVMVFFGEISFSLYLLHMLVIGVLYRHRVLPTGWPAWVAVGVSILLAWISYTLIERPGMKLGHRLAGRIRAGSSELGK